MDITQEHGTASFVITGYDDSAVIVNQTRYTNSMVIMPEKLITQWEPRGLNDLELHHLDEIADLTPGIVLLGTGPVLEFPDQAVLGYFLQRGIGIEVMDTAAACRTYNILMSEGRNVAAVILLMGTNPAPQLLP